jgi:hypothetical protein
MSPYDVANQRQSQSASLGVVDQRITHSIKLVEDLEMFLRRNADAMIDDLQVDAVAVTVKANRKVFLI